ncbi:WG repeat-containing protein [Brumimicrobium aurantiacum]|uniref:WG repeat-containing protein n=1 Tax=Brumimicrobium aurantiacum TaxID=1737063 RepID=A0A3E1EWM5_9FLAO|nr:WG repeat-containing protein [Brumimicrobium aurantiacum]RFC53956.1 hypothetical protein DXU93_10440 [Brumimicrobium aurantiacum]
MNRTQQIIIVFITLLSLVLGSCKINKGFEALNNYNYFDAKQYFEKSLKKDESPAAYGLSLIYFRNDNPFHHQDSAYHYSLLSIESYKEATQKTRDKWLEKLDFSIEKAKQHRKAVSDYAFLEAEKENSVVAYQYFIAKNPWSAKKEIAERRRDSLAFYIAKEDGSSYALSEYIRKFEDSEWRHKAQSLLFRAQYNETIKGGKTASFLEFIEKFPNNPLVRDAHYQVYMLETKEKTISAFNSFIRRYPDNVFIDDAWTSLYRLSIADYQKETILSFSNAYPDFPFPELIEQDLKLVGKKLYQFIQNNKYGFMDERGNVVIKANFEYAGQFKNGLAVVIKEGNHGYINKDGELLIDYQYEEAMDFDQGRAVVVEKDKYGMIDVSGTYVLNPEFEDIGSFNDGIAYVQSDSGFQYYTLDGSLAFSTIFDEAFAHQDGKAKVRKGNESGYIGLDGSFIVSTTNGTLTHFKDSIYVHILRDSMNLMYANGTYLFENGFDQIGTLVNNRAIVERDGKFGFVNGKGEIVIPIKHHVYPNYLQFSQFKNGHVILKRMNKYAMIDSVGNSVLPAIFKGIGTYGDLIPVSKGDGWGYANSNVRLKIDYQYDYAFEFVNGKAIVEKEGKVGLIDIENELIVPLEFESIKRLSDSILLVKKQGLYGLIGIDNSLMVEVSYHRISEYSPNLYQLVKDHEVSYFDKVKKEIISLKE